NAAGWARMDAKSLFVAEHPKQIVTIGAAIFVNTGRLLGINLTAALRRHGDYSLKWIAAAKWAQ
ncbi:MAG TPA: hypothetical protein VII95_01475, partial [Terriglobales bacterium]